MLAKETNTSLHAYYLVSLRVNKSLNGLFLKFSGFDRCMNDDTMLICKALVVINGTVLSHATCMKDSADLMMSSLQIETLR